MIKKQGRIIFPSSNSKKGDAVEHIVIFTEYEDKTGGFKTLQERVNDWLLHPDNQKMEVLDRLTNLTPRSGLTTMMVITIFYREKEKK